MRPDLEKIRHKFETAIERIPIAGCWIWMMALNRPGGHGVIGDGNGRPTRLVKAHRLAWMLYKGEIPEGFNINHACDVGCCCNPEHLYVGTQLENLEDSRRSGKLGTGRNSGRKNGSNCRLEEEQVMYLRSLKERADVIAYCNEIGITLQHASFIRSGKRWKHLPLVKHDE